MVKANVVLLQSIEYCFTFGQLHWLLVLKVRAIFTLQKGCDKDKHYMLNNSVQSQSQHRSSSFNSGVPCLIHDYDFWCRASILDSGLPYYWCRAQNFIGWRIMNSSEVSVQWIGKLWRSSLKIFTCNHELSLFFTMLW